jgi:DNA mismatch repair ATPase MutS
MIGKRKKGLKEKLSNSFGETKDEFFDFQRIEKYFRKKNDSTAFQIISDKTSNDLDLDEVFMFLDRTNSKIGQQYLYNKLRTIPNNSSKTLRDEKIIDQLSKDSELRIALQIQLSKLNNTEAYYITTLFQDEHPKPPKWFFVVRLLSLIAFATLLMTIVSFKTFPLLVVVFAINTWIHIWNKKNLYEYLSSLPQLLKLNDVAKTLIRTDIGKEINPNIYQSTGIIDKIKHHLSLFALETKLQGDLQQAIWFIAELLKTLLLIEPLFLFHILKELDTKRTEIEDVFTFVGEIDTLISIASLRKGLNHYCLPTISKERTLTTKNVFHPLIPNCIENSIRIGKKSILLTGSNMSGKTSFIRTIGINTITGQTINTCFADEFSLSKMNIFSAIRISDDLMNDKSYYFEEVLTIKSMIDNSANGKTNLFLLDEIFKGTNTIERISAGKAVLSAISKENNIVFVSTHDIELADLLKNEYELYHFSEIVDHKSVDFDYKLKEGKLKDRNAIRILQINDYPEELIQEAIEISKELDRLSAINYQQANLQQKE